MNSKQTQRKIISELITAKLSIQDPDDWCQGQYRDGGKSCAIGALPGVYKMDGAYYQSLIAMECLEYLKNAGPRNLKKASRVVTVNDVKGHAAVMRMYGRAIVQAEADLRKIQK